MDTLADILNENAGAPSRFHLVHSPMVFTGGVSILNLNVETQFCVWGTGVSSDSYRGANPAFWQNGVGLVWQCLRWYLSTADAHIGGWQRAHVLQIYLHGVAKHVQVVRVTYTHPRARACTLFTVMLFRKVFGLKCIPNSSSHKYGYQDGANDISGAHITVRRAQGNTDCDGGYPNQQYSVSLDSVSHDLPPIELAENRFEANLTADVCQSTPYKGNAVHSFARRRPYRRD
jgi:hypothetical protein